MERRHLSAKERRLNKAVKAALAAQGNIISPGQHLDIQPFLEKPKRKGKFSHVIDGKPRTYQQLWNEKRRAGFKHLTVREYCDFLAMQEMD